MNIVKYREQNWYLTLDIAFHVLASQLSGHRNVISNRRHQQNVKWASETWGCCVRVVVLSSFVDSLCRVRKAIMYVLSRRTVNALTSVHVGVYFLPCCATPEINTTVTLFWAHKQFITRVHSLFSMSFSRNFRKENHHSDYISLRTSPQSMYQYKYPVVTHTWQSGTLIIS